MLGLATVMFSIFNSLSSSGFAVFLSQGGGSVAVVDSVIDTVFTVEAAPGERLSYLAISGFNLVYISSSDGLVQIDILTDESVVLSSGHTGVPWFSSDGDLWYTFDGSLYRNGVSTGVAVPSFQVSVENDITSFTDRNDDLHILSSHCLDDYLSVIHSQESSS